MPVDLICGHFYHPAAMISSSRIKHIASLRIPKYREIHRQTIAEGTRLITEMLLTGHPFEEVACTKEWAELHPEPAARVGSRLTQCSPKEIERMSALKTPQGVLAVIGIPESTSPLPNREFTLYCDHISDPGNLGTILRIADWFGIGQVVTSPGSVSLYNPKVIQASMGSFFRVHHATAPLQVVTAAAQLPLTVYGAVMDGTPLGEVLVNRPAVIVIGNESEGISGELLARCHQRVTIPGGRRANPGESAESLNAAIAAAILCNHFTSDLL